MENYYIVQYIADTCGNVTDDDIEGVFTLESFDRWLAMENKMRVSDGNEPLDKDEFKFISTRLFI